MRLRRPTHYLAPIAVVMVVAGGLAVAAPSSADESHTHGTETTEAPEAQTSCTAEEKQAITKLGDNFASACVAGNDLANLGANNPVVPAG